MTFDESLEYMQSLNKRGIKPGLTAIEELCDKVGKPQDKLKFIQIAGTNGKGSTSLFISKILAEAGYKVGTYASPKVFEELEIIKINGRNISKKDYARLVDVIALNNESCTRFEVETVLAFMYFAEKNCDFVVLEAGMGGLLDATNVVSTTVASVFTSIGMDHMQFLGDTITKIAENKAGIIKDDSIVVSTSQDKEVLEVLKKKSIAHNSAFIVSDYNKTSYVKFKVKETVFDYLDIKNIKIKLLGTYQLVNACLAIDTIKSLAKTGVNISNNAILRGLANAKEEGRFETISENPRIIIDGAHNLPAAIALRDSLQTYCNNKKLVYIMGMFKDKSVEDVVSLMSGMAAQIITVTLPNKDRSMSNLELAKIVKDYNPMVTTADSIYEAVELATLMADKDTVVVAFGSLSHLNDIKKAVGSIQSAKLRGLKV